MKTIMMILTALGTMQALACTNDMQCGYGNKCVVVSNGGSTFYGVCANNFDTRQNTDLNNGYQAQYGIDPTVIANSGAAASDANYNAYMQGVMMRRALNH